MEEQEPDRAVNGKRGVVMVRASDIRPENVSWIWPGVVPVGRITGLAGYPGLGKSQVAINIAATVSTGRPWPGEVANEAIGDVIILSAEDDASDTLKPRLMAAGADCSRVHILTAIRGEDGRERPFNLGLDLDRLEKEDLSRVRLLIIDPASAYTTRANGSRLDRNSAGDVRTMLGRLTSFASRHRIGVLAVSHLNKSSGARAVARVMGSQEWVAVPRAVFLVTDEPGTDRRLFTPIKNNLAPNRLGYAFEIEDRVVEGIRTSAIVWTGVEVPTSADEALSASPKTGTSGAMDFLEEALKDGPADQTEIVRLGEEAGFTPKMLRTARERLGVAAKKEGFGLTGKWLWVPPGDAKVLRLVVDNAANGTDRSNSQGPKELVQATGDSEGEIALSDT
jgi:putative DNA primase/helicase